MSTDKFHLSLGSNLGDRVSHLLEGLNGLRVRGAVATAVSSIYETDPVGFQEQGLFLNLAAEVRWEGDARDLLAACLEVERDRGRIRSRRDGPRTLDIDILLWGSRVVRERDLLIPHPRMAQRRFVLVPLEELAPDLIHPTLGESCRRLLAGCRDVSGVRRFLPPPSLERGDPSGYNPSASRG